MKRILIDLYKLKNIYNGLGQFSLSFGKHLEKEAPRNLELSYLLPLSSEFHFSERIRIIRTNLIRRYLPQFNAEFDIWHSLQQFPSFYPKKNTLQILTIHDLNFLKEKDGKKSAKYLKKLQENINKADFLTTISNYSKSQIEEHCELNSKEIEVIYNGVELGNEVAVCPDFLDSEDEYFFSIGAVIAKKNFKVLIDIMHQFPQKKLIIAGKKSGSYASEMQELIDRKGLQDRIQLVGLVNNSERKFLYENASAFLFPSIAEGFGLPIIEAMNAACPVFCSNQCSLPEIGSDCAYYFDHFESSYMARIIKEGLEDFNSDREGNEQKLKARAGFFSWNNSIKKYIEFYEKCLLKITK